MRNIRTMLAVLAFSIPCIVWGGNVGSSADLSGLSEKQRLEVLQKIEDAKNVSKESVTDPKKISEWLGIGQQVAGLVPIFAEKTTIAAQQVLESTPGRILLAIVLVKMFWGKIVGVCFLTVGFFAWWHMFKKTFLIKEVRYEPHPNQLLYKWLGVRQKTVVRADIAEVHRLFQNELLFWVFVIAGILNMAFGVIGIMH